MEKNPATQDTIQLTSGQCISIGKKLHANIKLLCNLVKNYDEDVLLVIDGAEGAGKSKFARQLAKVCSLILNTEFNIDNIHFDLKSYIKACEDNNKKRGYIALLDETRKVLNRRRAMSVDVVDFTNYLSECRSNGHIHILCMPAIHDIDKYITQWRTKLFLHVEKFLSNEEDVSKRRLLRGHYKMIHPDDMLPYLNSGQKYGKYKYPKRYVENAYFSNTEVLELEEYEEKKAKYRKEKYVEKEVEVKKTKNEFDSERLKQKGHDEYSIITSRSGAYKVNMMERHLAVYFYKRHEAGETYQAIAKEFGMKGETLVAFVNYTKKKLAKEAEADKIITDEF